MSHGEEAAFPLSPYRLCWCGRWWRSQVESDLGEKKNMPFPETPVFPKTLFRFPMTFSLVGCPWIWILKPLFFLPSLTYSQPEKLVIPGARCMSTRVPLLSTAPHCGWLQGGDALLQIELLENSPDFIYYYTLGADLLISSNYLLHTTTAILSRSHLRLLQHRKPCHFQKPLVREKGTEKTRVWAWPEIRILYLSNQGRVVMVILDKKWIHALGRWLFGEKCLVMQM